MILQEVRSAMPKSDTANAQNNEALDQAIKNIYRSYGRNLSAFFRDVRNGGTMEDVRTGNITQPTRRHGQIYQTKRRDKIKAKRGV